MQRAEPQRRHRPHRHASDHGLGDGEPVEQPDEILAQLIEIRRPRRHARAAMAALVVAQDAKPVAEPGDLIVPQGEIGHQRIAEHEPGRALGAVEPAAEAEISQRDESFHRGLSPGDRAHRD